MKSPTTLLALCFIFLVVKPSAAVVDPVRTLRKVTIDNANPRRDTSGEIIDAHDGCLKLFNGRYYLYGTRYGKTDGFQNQSVFVVYSSADLMSWTKEGVILKTTLTRNDYRPHVVYNARTKKYVLWYSSYEGVSYARLVVATADQPEGPFEIVNGDVHMKHEPVGDIGYGDHGLFVDEDGTAYLTYTSGGSVKDFPISEEPIPYLNVLVEKLGPDYLSSAGEVTEPIAGNVESPALFRRGELYYLLFDNTCAFCEAGSGVRVYTAQHPLGPYTYRGNINRVGADPRKIDSPWGPLGTGRADAIVKAQQNHVAVLPGKDGDVYLWMGDRWGSTPDGTKGHDFQDWEPLTFEADGMIQQLKVTPLWTMEVPAARAQVADRAGAR